MAKKNTTIPEHILELITVKSETTREFYERTVKQKPIAQSDGAKAPKGKLWCPYEGNFTKFINKRDCIGSYKRCESCGISTEDFWVKTYNKLW